MTQEEEPDLTKLSPAGREVLRILKSEDFRDGLRFLVAREKPDARCSAMALRTVCIESAEFGVLTVICSGRTGHVRKVYRELGQEETDSRFRCSREFAKHVMDKLDGTGWRHCRGYEHVSQEPMMGTFQHLEVYVLEPGGAEQSLRLDGAELSPDRRMRRVERRLRRLT